MKFLPSHCNRPSSPLFYYNPLGAHASFLEQHDHTPQSPFYRKGAGSKTSQSRFTLPYRPSLDQLLVVNNRPPGFTLYLGPSKHHRTPQNFGNPNKKQQVLPFGLPPAGLQSTIGTFINLHNTTFLLSEVAAEAAGAAVFNLVLSIASSVFSSSISLSSALSRPLSNTAIFVTMFEKVLIREGLDIALQYFNHGHRQELPVLTRKAQKWSKKYFGGTYHNPKGVSGLTDRFPDIFNLAKERTCSLA